MGPWGNVPERMILRTRESLVVIQENDLTMAEAKTGLLTFLWHEVESAEVEEDVVPVVFEASEPSG